MTGRHTSVGQTFEVRVRSNGQVRMLHFLAHSHYQAICKARDCGYPVLSVRKANRDKLFRNIESMRLAEYVEGEYHPALSIDGLHYHRRKERIKNREKDKENY